MAKSSKPPANAFVATARKLYNPLGFSKGYNFTLFFITVGGLMGFTLARLQYLNIDGIFCKPGDEGAMPGECFYYTRPSVERIGIILHLGCILPASFLVCFQFLPIIRYKALMFHRVNGYTVILLSLVGTAGAWMVSRKTAGGAIAGTSLMVFLGGWFVVSLGLAYVNIKRLQIEQHRAWMIRAWMAAGCIITSRLIIPIIAMVMSSTPGGYFTAKSCEVIEYILEDRDEMSSLYPVCDSYLKGDDQNVYAAVQGRLIGATSAVEVSAALQLSFVASLWIAFVIHLAAAEIYLHLTPAEAIRLRQLSTEKQAEAGMHKPGSAGLTSDRLGDAPEWKPVKLRSVLNADSSSVSSEGEVSQSTVTPPKAS